MFVVSSLVAIIDFEAKNAGMDSGVLKAEGIETASISLAWWQAEVKTREHGA